MVKQLSVQGQNAFQKADMLRVARMFSNRKNSMTWLQECLQAHQLNPAEGKLVRFKAVPDQEGTYVLGTWLTTNRKFWEFEVIVSCAGETLIRLDRFEETTASVVVSANLPGVGKSFGCLAIEVLIGEDGNDLQEVGRG